ncbi:MAG TPA: hypothetical protein DCM05_17115 [Elusimicrobia bacterium]|nr:hypothetical protein [Elusimicrobiota bacterium]
MVERRLLISTLLLSAACAGAPPRPAPPPPRPAPPPLEASRGCSSSQYRFACALPPNYLVTQEGPGPGTVLQLRKRSRTQGDAPELRLRVIPLKGRALKRFVSEKVAGPLRSAAGVSGLVSRPAKLGGKDGFEVSLTRTYATGSVALRVFCFRRGKDAFLVDFTVPDSVPSGVKDELADFVSSIEFEEEP